MGQAAGIRSLGAKTERPEGAFRWRTLVRPLAAEPNAQTKARRIRAFPEFKRARATLTPHLASRLLAAADWTLIAAAFFAVVHFAYALPLSEVKLDAAWRLAWILVLLKAGLWIVRAYAPGAGLKHAERALGGLVLGAIGGLAACAFLAPDDRAATALAIALPIAAIAMAALHSATAWLLGRDERAGAHAETAIIVGATQAASRVIARARQSGRLRVAAVVDDRLRRAPARVDSIPVSGSVNDLLAWSSLHEIDRIIVALDAGGDARARDIVHRLRVLPHRVDLAVDMKPFGQSGDRRIDAVACMSGGYFRPGFMAAKRAMDILLGGLLTILFLPLMAVIALLVKMTSRGPVLFTQARHGLNNKIIKIVKFRTMRHDPKANQSVLQQTRAKDPRVTIIGRFLRVTSLDELPQLFNVLNGEMSLVGPRPHALNMRAGDTALERIALDYAHRHRLRPGLTGWAQINGSRGPIETPEAVRERVRLDLEYVAHASIWLDLWILMRTLPALLGDRQCTR